ncbi:MAG: hypothetical protein OEW52_00110 [Thermoleophilia bacterium]|nr:hypothetical protein [Thermoleophilia bacterium]
MEERWAWIDRLMPVILAVVPIAAVEWIRRKRAARLEASTSRETTVQLNLEETKLIHEERRADLDRLREEIERVEERANTRYAALEEAERECQDDRHRLRVDLAATNERLFILEERVRQGRPDLLEGDREGPRHAGGAA